MAKAIYCQQSPPSWRKECRRSVDQRHFEKGCEPGPWGKSLSTLPDVGDIEKPLWEWVALQLANATVVLENVHGIV